MMRMSGHRTPPSETFLVGGRNAYGLAERDGLLELAERSAGIGIWDMDMKSQLVRGTPQFFRNLGLPMHDHPVPINQIRALRHPEDGARVVEAFQSAISSGAETFETEYRIVRPDGEVRWIFGRGRVIRDQRAVPIRYSGIDIDVTERKVAELALLQSEERYRTLVENASDLVFTLDLNLNLTSVNPAASRFLGYKTEEMIGRPLQQFVPADQLGMHHKMLKDKISGNTAETRYEMRVIDKEGRTRVIETNSRLSFDRDGKPEAIHAIARDITDRKKYEEHLALTTRELSHRTKNILAVIQAIATQIGKRSNNFHEFEERLIGCVAALAHSHDLLVEGDWQGAEIEELVRRQLTPFGLDDARINTHGRKIFVKPQATQLLGLAFHELATNAIKYGALSNLTGSVTIEWRRDSEGNLQVTWTESGGPAVVQPTRRGFGSTVLERMAASVDGQAKLAFRPEGLSWTVIVGRTHLLD
jgi:PAS domain S-box-containing protein